MKQTLKITMPDGSKWTVPVMIIARNRAENYKEEFGNDVEKSLAEDTIPLFETDDFEIIDWAVNNMNWSDVVAHAVQLPRGAEKVDYQEGWVNGDKELI